MVMAIKLEGTGTAKTQGVLESSGGRPEDRGELRGIVKQLQSIQRNSAVEHERISLLHGA